MAHETRSASELILPTRRRFLERTARVLVQAPLGLAAFATAGAFAEELTRTPHQTEGPFYPDKLPLDTDNDLLIINDKITPAVGEITWLTGRVLDARGEPIRGAVVEIWQTDNNGVYLHSKSNDSDRLDANFQGFGRFLTGVKGEYSFRTIKPRPYPGRTPHIHFAIKKKGMKNFSTQCYVRGEPKNEKDGVLSRIRDKKQRENIIIDFRPIKGSRTGELAAHFDIILGWTPADEPKTGAKRKVEREF